MAKGNKPGGKGVYMKQVGKNNGTQKIVSGGDYGAREAWGAAANPPSVKSMVGKSEEFASYKHNNS